MKRILVAVDGSDPALRALDLACQIAAASRAECLIVTAVAGPKSPQAEALARIEHATVEEISETWASAVAEEAVALSKRVGVTDVTMKVVFGDPAVAILAEALAWGADIIAIGRRGRGRLEGLLLGSVSQKLITLSRVPILVAP